MILLLRPGVITLTVFAVLIFSTSAQVCTVKDFAGRSGNVGFSGDGGSSLNAFFDMSLSGGVWADTSNTVFIADYGNNRVREVNPDNQIVTTIAGLISVLNFEKVVHYYFFRIQSHHLLWREGSGDLCWYPSTSWYV